MARSVLGIEAGRLCDPRKDRGVRARIAGTDQRREPFNADRTLSNNALTVMRDPTVTAVVLYRDLKERLRAPVRRRFLSVRICG